MHLEIFFSKVCLPKSEWVGRLGDGLVLLLCGGSCFVCVLPRGCLT